MAVDEFASNFFLLVKSFELRYPLTPARKTIWDVHLMNMVHIIHIT